MKCKHKFKNGKQCKYLAYKDGLCAVHHPKVYPVYFIKDYGSHKEGSYAYNNSFEQAVEYIFEDVAVPVNYETQVLLDKLLKRRLLIYRKGLFKGIKKAVVAKDEKYISNFFKNDSDPNSKSVQSFLNDKELTKKEREYLKDFLTKKTTTN